MIQIRQGVFETNSSSSHSVTIAQGSFIPDRLHIENGVCVVYPGEFGWGVDRFQDAPTKASYCLTWAKNMKDLRAERLLSSVIKEVTGAKEVQFYPMDHKATEYSKAYTSWGYIDHQSLEHPSPGEKVFENRQNLKKFIFNSGSILVIDNDNY